MLFFNDLENYPERKVKYYFPHFTDEKTNAQWLHNLTMATLQAELMEAKSLDSSSFSKNKVSLKLSHKQENTT